MQSFIQPFNVLLPLLYGTTLLFYVFYLNSGSSISGSLGQKFLGISLLIHSGYFIARSNLEYFPITNSFDSLSMVAACIALIYLIIERSTNEGKTGAFFISITFIFQAVASMFHVNTMQIHELLANPVFGVHVFLTLSGISALAISGLYGLMYWMLARQIKSHNLGIIYKGMPPLERLETMGGLSSALGLISFGLGLLMGHFYAYKMFNTFFPADMKIIINDVAWLFYLIGWIIIKLKNYSGNRMSKLSFWGFIGFATAIMAANFISNSFHRFN